MGAIVSWELRRITKKDLPDFKTARRVSIIAGSIIEEKLEDVIGAHSKRMKVERLRGRR